MILDASGNPIPKPEPERRLEVLSAGQQPSPEFLIETTPGAVSEHMAILRYKAHRFEEPLPATFMMWDETSQQLYCQPVMQRLAMKLKPILDGEDEPVPELTPEQLAVGDVIFDFAGQTQPSRERESVARIHSGGVYVFDGNANWRFLSSFELRTHFRKAPEESLDEFERETREELRRGELIDRLPQVGEFGYYDAEPPCGAP